MTITLILVACYLWALMVYSDAPEKLSFRRAIFAPITLSLIFVAVLLVTLVNLLIGTEIEVQL